MKEKSGLGMIQIMENTFPAQCRACQFYGAHATESRNCHSRLSRDWCPKHKFIHLLLPTLLLKTPWLQEGEEKVFNDGQWINAKTLSHMPKPEAQVWLCLRALLAEPVCSGRHDYFDPTFERSLTDLKSKLLDCSGRSRLIDQIPQLGGDGLQRAILYHLHEIQRNRRTRVETTLCDMHVLTKNMNAMKGKDMNAGDSSQDKAQKTARLL